jgi:2-keto-4-pentenoate hydratase
MALVAERLVAATRAQLAARQRLLDGGAAHVGWKLGMGDRESIDGHIAVGYLTSATLLEPGQAYAADPRARLHVDAEACAQLAGPDEIAAYGVALEIVDLAPLAGEPDSVIAANVFHLAVGFGPLTPDEPVGAAVGLWVNGSPRAAGRWPADLRERLARAAAVLHEAGEQLRVGDRVITGSIVQLPVAAGDQVAVTVGEDSAVTAQII